MRNSNGIRYFWLGLGMGAGAAILLAPRSGPETRRYCQTKAQDATDSMRRQAQELRDRTVQSMEHGRQNLQRQMERLSAALDAGTRAFKRAS